MSQISFILFIIVCISFGQLCDHCEQLMSQKHCEKNVPTCTWKNNSCIFVNCNDQNVVDGKCESNGFVTTEGCYPSSNGKCTDFTGCSKMNLTNYEQGCNEYFLNCQYDETNKKCKDRVTLDELAKGYCKDRAVDKCSGFDNKDVTKKCYISNQTEEQECKSLSMNKQCSEYNEEECQEFPNSCIYQDSKCSAFVKCSTAHTKNGCIRYYYYDGLSVNGCKWDGTSCIDDPINGWNEDDCINYLGLSFTYKNNQCVVCSLWVIDQLLNINHLQFMLWAMVVIFLIIE